MGKGTKKKTVWRTFSFENGYTNGTNDADTNGLTASHHQKNGLDNDVSSRSSISNGKFVANWRTQRYNDDENDSGGGDDAKYHIDTNGNVNGSTDNGHHRAFYKRTPLADKYPLRGNGLRKAPSHFQENGNKTDFHDIHENPTMMKSSQFRSSRLTKVPASRHVSNHKKWDSRNGNYNSNGLSNYSRGFRKSHFAHSDQSSNENNNTDEHFNENGLAKNARNADDSDKCQDNVNGGSNSAQQRPDQHQRSLQLNKFNEDEYTRISTPRSEVLFKKGYLMRDKKYVGTTNTMSTTATTSSNDSGSVSVVSNEETASYYSIQSMSPDNSTYLNGNNSSDSTSATYPNDGFEHDLSLIYSSGFYDNNGYFYVNPYIHNNFDQFNGPTILMPYGSAPTTKDIDDYDTDAFPPAPLSPGATDAKSVDEEHANNYNSINSEDMSNSSLSENVSINNDPDTPPNPLTPPPSPLSPNEKPIARTEASSPEQNDKPTTDEHLIENEIENETDTQIETQDGQNITETLPDEQDEPPEAEGDAVVPDNYSMPYFSPFIFVPPIPFVPDARMAGSRRGGKFRRHSSNHFGRPKRNSRFSHFYNKVYIPTNWSEAPDETAQNSTNEEEVVEPKSGEENAIETAPTPTIEQCDTILKNSKLNLNVSEFIPQSKRMIFVPLPIPPSPPASVYFVPIPSTESTLNVNVPEFLPKNYKPVNAEADEGEIDDVTPVATVPSQPPSMSSSPPTSTAKTTTTTETTTTKMTTITNESAKNQNETTNIHTNGLNTDTKCTQVAAASALDNQHVTNGVHTNVSNAMKNENNKNNNNNNNNSNHNKHDYVAAIKQHGVTVTIMSDLLKTNSDNLNLDACSFNNENSHTNLKADLGNKKITNNISKNKVYKNDNYYNVSGSNKSTKIMNSNKNAKTRHAYPKTKETSSHDKPCDSLTTVATNKTNDRRGGGDVDNGPKAFDGGKMSEKLNEKPGLTYAQMVVPTKSTDIKITTLEMTDEAAKVAKEAAKMMADVKVTLPENSKLSKSLIKGKNSHNNNRKSHPNKKKPVPENRNERPKLIEGSVEWFTVGAKGKKHVASNDSTVAEIAFENESKVEIVNKIAEELQLDINKDADLAMDIMDSLTITEEKPEEIVIKAPRKKKITVKPKKKATTKDKVNKEQKRRATFDIIEPNFESQKNELNEITTEEIATEEHYDEIIVEAEQDTIESSLDNFVFDPNVFATPCNLQMDSMQRSTGGKLGNSLRLSTGKPVRNLINPFDIYQQDFTSIENQQLKQEEEMVIKILQQLNKSFDGKATPPKVIEDIVPEVLQHVKVETTTTTMAQTTSTAVNHELSARENSVERFAINAKPNQNVYSSNHFLEHFFGDRNDKCDQVVTSTDLSSSDQSYVEEENEQDNDNNEMHENFDTYPAIGNEDDHTDETLHENGLECDVKSIEKAEEANKDDINSELHKETDEKIECNGVSQDNETKNPEISIENGIEHETNDISPEECIEIQQKSITSEIVDVLDQTKIQSQIEIENHIEPKEEVLNITQALEQILKRRSEIEFESKVEENLQDKIYEAKTDSSDSEVQNSHTEFQEEEIQESHKLQEKEETRKSEERTEKLEVIDASWESIEEVENTLEVESETKLEVEIVTETQAETSSIEEQLEQKTETQAFEITENDTVTTKPMEDNLTELNESIGEFSEEPIQSISEESTELVCHGLVPNEQVSANCEEIHTVKNESTCDKQNEMVSQVTESVAHEAESLSHEVESVPYEKESCHEEIESVCIESAKSFCEESQPTSEVQESACDKTESTVQIKIQFATLEDEQKDSGIMEIDAEPISLETEASSIETDPHDVASSISCNQSIKSNSSSGTRPWLRIVDTQMLQQQKKLQQTFPITTAVSMWLNQVQKEKTPEPIFRVPDSRFFTTTTTTHTASSTKYKKQDSQASHSNSSIDLTEDTASITSDRFHINDDEEEDIMNFWESPMMTPQSPTPPPFYNSVYGSSINYANLISNKNELLCNNIIDYDAANGKHSATNEKHNKNGFNQINIADTAKPGIDEKCYRPPPEVCCTIM